MALLFGVLLLQACANVNPQSTEEVVAEGAKALPDETMQHWVTYGDHFVQVSAISEHRLPAPKEEVETGEGFISRQVELGFDKTWWSRSQTVARSVPASLTMANGGWKFNGDLERPWRIEGQQELKPGKQYLAVVAYGDTSIAGGDGSAGPSWFCIDLVPFEAGVIGKTDVANELSEAREALVGKTAAQAVELLESTPPDPRAKPYMSEDPVLRYAHVVKDEAKDKPAVPYPGEK